MTTSTIKTKDARIPHRIGTQGSKSYCSNLVSFIIQNSVTFFFKTNVKYTANPKTC